MSEPFHLITVSSWEERSILGFKRLLETGQPGSVQMYHFREYDGLSLENRKQIGTLCNQSGIAFSEGSLGFSSPADTWKAIAADVIRSRLEGKRVVVDITTMPRDVIWTVFFNLLNIRAIIEYVYHRPTSYASDWLSRDPGRPRLLFKMSGVARFDRPTALVLTTGYDTERTQQMIRSFEPQRVALFIQSGQQFSNDVQNVASHQTFVKEENREYKIDAEPIDAYSPDHGEESLGKWVASHVHDHNIIMSSLGPKLSAVAMFRLHKHFPDTALCYAPSKEFNPEYSKGIGDSVMGQLAG